MPNPLYLERNAEVQRDQLAAKFPRLATTLRGEHVKGLPTVLVQNLKIISIGHFCFFLHFYLTIFQKDVK